MPVWQRLVISSIEPSKLKIKMQFLGTAGTTCMWTNQWQCM